MPNPKIVGHLEGPITIKPEVSLPCNNHCRDPDRKPQKVLTDVIAGEAVQRDNEGKMPVHVDDDDPEHVTNKKVKGIGPGEATKGNRAPLGTRWNGP